MQHEGGGGGVCDKGSPSIKANLHGNNAFAEIMQELDRNLDEIHKINMEKSHAKEEILREKEPVPYFDKFMRTTYGNYGRDSPIRNKLDLLMGTSAKKNAILTPTNKV